MAGFIHDKLDIKLLVLYILDRAAAPIDFATLTDLSMCDGGVVRRGGVRAAGQRPHRPGWGVLLHH